MDKALAQGRIAAEKQTTEMQALRNLRNGLIRLRKELRLPATLQEAGISAAALGQHKSDIVAAALKDPCMDTNPVKWDAAVLQRILEAVSGRG